jgi:hypothetical protein
VSFIVAKTPARTDLPNIGDIIAAKHNSGQWYFGPHKVVDVDPVQGRVEIRPLYWPPERTMVFTPSKDCPHPLEWNRMEDLNGDEREYIEQRDRK